MKKAVAFILLIVTVTLLCACGSNVKVKHGSTEGNIYTNESIGLKFTKPDKWTFATESEIANIMNIAAEEFDIEEMLEQGKTATIVEFLAMDRTTGNNVSMNFENLEKSNSTLISEKKYIEYSKEKMQEQFKSHGYEFGEIKDAKLGNVNFKTFEATCKYNGVSMKQQMYIKKYGSYMAVITITVVNGASVSDVENMFS